MSGEPLWRGPTDEYGDLRLVAVTDGLAEVEVWRAGDRPVPPTRELMDRFLAELRPVLASDDVRRHYLETWAEKWLALFSGVPTEPEETR